MKNLNCILFFFGLSVVNIFSQTTQEIDHVYNQLPSIMTCRFINSDTLPDIVVGSGKYYVGDLAWYAKNPDSEIYTPHQIQNDEMQIYQMQILDKDLDGDNDIIVSGDGEHKIIIYNQITPDSFVSEFTEYDDSTDLDFEKYVGAINQIDVDADGDQDLVVIGPKNASQFTMAWLENSGDTTKWAYHTILPVVYGQARLVCDDFNNDGLTDVMSIDISPDFNYLYFKNTGSGFNLTEIPDDHVGSGLYIGSADMNLDGYPDLISFISELGPGSYPLEILYNSDGEFSAAIKVTIAEVPQYATMAPTDYDMDGDMDIVFQSVDEINLLRNTGTGDFEMPVIIWDTVDCNFEDFFVGDVNGDQLPDFLLNDAFSAEYINEIFPLIHIPDTDTLKQGDKISNFSWFRYPGIGDINNDGNMDIIGSVNRGYISGYYFNPADDLYSKNINAIMSVDSGCNYVLLADAGDVDQDGYCDFAAVTTYDDDACTQLKLYHNQHDSTFISSDILMEGRIVHTGGDGIINAFFTDLNGDGDLDFCAISSVYDDLEETTEYFLDVFENADGNFEKLPDLDLIYNNAANLQAADIDNDGDEELFVTSEYNTYLIEYENMGALNFAAPEIIITSDSLTSYRFINSDGDLFPDMLTSYGSYNPYLSINTAGEFAIPVLINNSIRGTGVFDLNFDGRDEIIGVDADYNPVYVYNSFLYGLTGISKPLPDYDYPVFTDISGDGSLDILSQTYNEMKMIYDVEIDTSYVPVTEITSKINNANNFKIYPQPCRDGLTITATESMYSIALYDVAGHKLQYTENINQESTSFLLNNLPAGLYQLEVEFYRHEKQHCLVVKL